MIYFHFKELFAAVGALKKCRMIKAGTAEVIFFKKEEALQAIKRYHNRELDGNYCKRGDICLKN